MRLCDTNKSSRLIEQQYWGILEQGARNSNTLLLSSTQSNTAFANFGLIFVRERHDAVVQLRGVGCFFHFLLICPKLGITNTPTISNKPEATAPEWNSN